MITFPKYFIVSIGCIILLWMGCSYGPRRANYSRLGLVEISGTIKLDGQPLVGATVYFHDEVDQTYSFGKTDAAGRYQLMFDSIQTGVIPGTKRIEIVTVDQPDDESESDSEPSEIPTAASTAKERVPSRYNSQSTLIREVTVSDNEVDFDLTSDRP